MMRKKAEAESRDGEGRKKAIERGGSQKGQPEKGTGVRGT